MARTIDFLQANIEIPPTKEIISESLFNEEFSILNLVLNLVIRNLYLGLGFRGQGFRREGGGLNNRFHFRFRNLRPFYNILSLSIFLSFIYVFIFISVSTYLSIYLSFYLYINI